MQLYDNLDDARTKLNATLCMYNGNAVQVKEIAPDDDGMPYTALTKSVKNIIPFFNLDDEDFNCTQFNVGYTNNDGVATWWCRRPLRQYRQGLRYDQMMEMGSSPGYRQRFKFDWCGPVISMLENNYPDLETCEKRLKDKLVLNIAFHKDFAASWDDIHDDMVIEYKANKIGMSHKFKKFKLLNEFEYLTETLVEITDVYR